MTWRRLVLSGTCLTVVGLGVLFAVVDLRVADQIAGAIGALAGVAGVGMSVVRMRSGQSDAKTVVSDIAERPTSPTSAGAASRSRSSIDASHARGVQIGDGNVQHNNFC